MSTTATPQPCAALSCEMFAPAGVKYCPRHAPLDLDGPDDLATWLECWVDENIGDDDHAGVMARRLLTVALDALHAYFVAFSLNDLGPTIRATDRAALLFGHERCRKCYEFQPTADLRLSPFGPLCGDCATAHDDDDDAFPYCRECLTYIDGDGLYCDEHRPAPTAPNAPTACRACGEYTVIRDRRGIIPDYCGDCDEHRPGLLTTCRDCGELSVSIDSEGFAPDYCDTCGGADRAD